MTNTWVINASPLILLGKLHCFELLEHLTTNIIVPQTVFDEVKVGQDITTNAALTWAEKYLQKDLPIPDSVIRWDLDAGESQVIAHALSNNYRAILDDGKGRACASAHNLPIVGSLGIILRAKQNGFIPLARPLVEQLLSSGSYLDKNLVTQALKMVGE